MSGFRRGPHEVFALLGCCAALVVSCCLFETAYRSHLQGSSRQRPPKVRNFIKIEQHKKTEPQKIDTPIHFEYQNGSKCLPLAKMERKKLKKNW